MTEAKLIQIEQALYALADELEAEWANLPPLSIDSKESRAEQSRRYRLLGDYHLRAGKLLVEGAEKGGFQGNLRWRNHIFSLRRSSKQSEFWYRWITGAIIRKSRDLPSLRLWNASIGQGQKSAAALRGFASRLRVTEPEKNYFIRQRQERRNRYRLPKEKRTVQSPYLPPTNGHEYKSLQHALQEPEKVVRLTLRWGDPLDERILQCSNLRYLRIATSQLELLPDIIGELKELRGLTLYGGVGYKFVPSHEIPPFIAQLQKLEFLDLRGKHIGQLPDEIGQLQNLRRLSLAYTRVETLPDSIGDLRQLRCLQIESSGLKHLPETMGGLEKLEILDVSSREFVALPDSIGALKRLEKLRLRNVSVSELPDTVGDLTALRELDISYSQIRRLPVSIGRLHNLRTLAAYRYSENPLELSPEVLRALERLPKLKKLVLPKANLADLPERLRRKVADG